MYKHILLAVDDSETALLALQEAIRFLENAPGSFLRIIHVADEFITYLETQPFNLLEMKEVIKKSGQMLLAKISTQLQAQKIQNFDTKLIEIDMFGETVYQKITFEAQNWPADLIIIGTHGRRGFRHFFLGSIAEGVIRTATVPVLMIRDKSE